MRTTYASDADALLENGTATPSTGEIQEWRFQRNGKRLFRQAHSFRRLREAQRSNATPWGDLNPSPPPLTSGHPRIERRRTAFRTEDRSAPETARVALSMGERVRLFHMPLSMKTRVQRRMRSLAIRHLFLACHAAKIRWTHAGAYGRQMNVFRVFS